jgi:hypothetical protein
VDKHASTEFRVFDAFLDASGLAVDRASIHKREPFDILCRAVDGTELAFQITEIVDRDWAALEGRTHSVHRLLETAYDAGASGWKDCISQRFGCCDIGIALAYNVGARAMQPTLPMLFEFIGLLPGEGRHDVGDSPLGATVRSVRIAAVGSTDRSSA